MSDRLTRSKAPAVAALLALALALGACHGGGAARHREEGAPTVPIAETIARHAPELMRIPGVVGVYEGESAAHAPCIRIMVAKRTPELERRLPRTLEGHPVEIEETGVIRPM